jgi:hypothetical protein
MEAAAVVTDIAGLRLRQHRQGSIVTMNSLSGEDVHLDQLIEWPRPPWRRASNPASGRTSSSRAVAANFSSSAPF